MPMPRCSVATCDSTGLKFGGHADMRTDSQQKIEGKTRPVKAGDAAAPNGCLTDIEMDSALGSLKFLPARAFFSLTLGEPGAAQAINTAVEAALQRDRQTSGDKANTAPGVLLIAHVRHHWVLCALQDKTDRGPARFFVFDSARSHPVERDLRSQAALLGWPAPEFVPCPQQGRGTNECGLFALVNFFLVLNGVSPSCSDVRSPSLSSLRGLFPSKDSAAWRREFLVQGCRAYGIECTPEPKTSEPPTTRQHNPYLSRQSFGEAAVGSHLDTPREKHLDPLAKPWAPTHTAPVPPPGVDTVSAGTARRPGPPRKPAQPQVPTPTVPAAITTEALANRLATTIEAARCRQVAEAIVREYATEALRRLTNDAESLRVAAEACFRRIVEEENRTQARQRGETVVITDQVSKSVREEAEYAVHLAAEEEKIAYNDSKPNTAIHTSTLDTLMSEALEAAQRVGNSSAANMKLYATLAAGRISLRNRSGPAYQSVARPLHYPPGDGGGHFSLLFVEFNSAADPPQVLRARVFDSLPAFRPDERDRLVREALAGHLRAGSFTGVEVINTGPQLTNECGFRVLRSFLQMLEVDRPWARAHVMALHVGEATDKRLIAEAKLRSLVEATAPTEAHDAANEEEFHEVVNLVEKAAVHPAKRQVTSKKHKNQTLSSSEEFIPCPKDDDFFSCHICGVHVAMTDPRQRSRVEKAHTESKRHLRLSRFSSPSSVSTPASVHSTAAEEPNIAQEKKSEEPTLSKVTAPALTPVGPGGPAIRSTSIYGSFVEDRGAGDASPITQVRRYMRKVSVGTILRVVWSLGDESGTWFGEVSRASGPGLDALINYRVEQCKCGCSGVTPIHADFLNSPIPAGMGVQYIAIDQLAQLPCCAPCTKPLPKLPIPEPYSVEGVATAKSRTQKLADKHPKKMSASPLVHAGKLTTHSSLETVLKQVANSDTRLLQVTCVTSRDNKDAQKETVVGSVKRAANTFELTIVASKCKDCQHWVMEDDSEPTIVLLPDYTFTYYDATILEDMTFDVDERCNCEEAAVVLDGIATPNFADEIRPDASLGWANADVLKGEVAAKWFIHDGKPPSIHTITWRQLAETTRSTHIRWLRLLKTMPRSWQHTSLGSAAVHLVLTEANTRGWQSWGTVSSALSSLASALRRLPEYTNSRQAIDLAKDIIFASAQKRAQQLARVTKRFTEATAMSVTQYGQILGSLKDPILRLFFTLGWAFAARMGDLRQVVGADVAFGEVRGDRQMLAVTFRSGKGAAFWGPFTIQTTVPISVAKDLALRIQQLGQAQHIFSSAEQQRLSKIIAETGLDLRSIRRGRLQSLANAGASNEELQLLSGHKRIDTLMRYLGWGRFSADGRAAAYRRDAREEEHVEGAGPAANAHNTAGNVMRAPEPPKMGLHSGYAGNKGKRISRPPGALPHKPPKRHELGIEVTPSVAATWPLKAKPIDTLDWRVVAEALSSNAGSAAYDERAYNHMKDQSLGNHLLNEEDWIRIDAKLATCQRWCGDAPMEEAIHRPDILPVDIPPTKIGRKDYDVLHTAKKLARLQKEDRIRGWASGYIIPQAAKQARRPVWETHFNQDNLPGQPTAVYTSRRVRRYLKHHPLTVDFDFTQFFDQFALSAQAQQWCIVRYWIQEADGTVTEELCKLTRLPMGATFAPATAQALTDVIIAPLLRMDGVKTFSMIDNVRIACCDEATLIAAIKIFLSRCAASGVKLNEPEWPDSLKDENKPLLKDFTDADWIRLGRAEGKIFLGEQFTATHVRNSPKNVAKLRDALGRLREAAAAPSADGNESPITHRNMVSLLSLLMYLQHTLDIHLCDTFGLLRSYSQLSVRAQHHGWDTPLAYVDTRLLATIEAASVGILRNEYQALPDEPSCPSTEAADYDIIITIDASAGAWAALVFCTHSSQEYLVRQGWCGAHFHHSTIAEPSALARCLEWLPQSRLYETEGLGRAPRIAVVTDHAAIVTGQRRWWNHHAGFSSNPWLNEAYRQLHLNNATAFHIPGHLNPADAASRAQYGPEIACTVVRGQLSLAIPLSALDRGVKDTEVRMRG